MDDSGKTASRNGYCTAINDRRFDMKMRMKLGSLHRVGLLAGALGVVVMAFAAQTGLAQQTAKDAPAVASAPAVAQVKAFEPAAFGAMMPGVSQQAAKPVPTEESDTAKANKPGGEGIKVHGHWKIVIKNPDGTVDSTTEFENSLVTPGGGDLVLASLLSGTSAMGSWIMFETNNNCVNSSQPYPCTISPAVVTFVPSNLSSTPQTPASLQLSGSFTAVSTGPLGGVHTQFDACLSTPAFSSPGPVVAAPIEISALQCVAANQPFGPALPADVTGYGTGFTSTTTSATITAVGQIVQITVTISFS
jgi:hypothetical protein